MDKESKKISSIFLRYFILLILGLDNFYIIQKILTPLTIFTTNTILSIFKEVWQTGNILILENIIVEIIPACVASAAFYLLLILTLSIPNVDIKTRLKAIVTSIVTLFILNIIRILILIQISGIESFELIHWIFWHLISIVFVVGIWLATIKLYKIKQIPIYSDILYIKRLIKPTKNTKRKKKNK